MFERYCRFFRRHFRVVPLRDLVERLERGQTLNRELAITFDDGYRDNFENAAPVLEKLSLPATFFIVTQWMGTRRRALVGPCSGRPPSVDDLGSGPLAPSQRLRHRRAYADARRSRPRRPSRQAQRGNRSARGVELERQLDAPSICSPIPTAGADNLADANRELVRDAGFRCCCSCFGGVIAPGTDPFHLAAGADLAAACRRRISSGSKWRSGAASLPRRATVLTSFTRHQRAAEHRKHLGRHRWSAIAATYVLTPFVIHTLGTGGLRHLDADHVDDRLHQPAGAGRADGLRALPGAARRRRRLAAR